MKAVAGIDVKFSYVYYVPVLQLYGFLFSLKTILAQHFFSYPKESVCTSITARLSYQEFQRVLRLFFPQSGQSVICLIFDLSFS